MAFLKWHQKCYVIDINNSCTGHRILLGDCGVAVHLRRGCPCTATVVHLSGPKRLEVKASLSAWICDLNLNELVTIRLTVICSIVGVVSAPSDPEGPGS